MPASFNYNVFLTVVTLTAWMIVVLSWITLSNTDNELEHLHKHKSNIRTNTNSKNKNGKSITSPPPATVAYDIVTLIHHDDMESFIDYGLRSWLIYLKDLSPSATIFMICSDKAYDAVTFHLQQETLSGHTSTHKIIPIREDIYPFNLEKVHDAMGSKLDAWHRAKPTWIYQQLLKLYSYQALSDTFHHHHQQQQHSYPIPKIKPWFTIIDSDTIFVQPLSLFNYDQHEQTYVPIYNIASPRTGAFPNDAILGDNLIQEVFPTRKNITKAYPHYRKSQFTAITHFMTMHGPTLTHMLDTIYNLHHQSPPWKVFSTLQHSVLSEWELYMAWIMNTKRNTFHVQQIPYVNWGLLEHTNLIALNDQSKSDIIYLSKHDDYNRNTKCCVNSNWRSKFGIQNCPCCDPNVNCDRVTITCQVLGIKGCRDVNSSGGEVNIGKNMTMNTMKFD